MVILFVMRCFGRIVMFKVSGFSFRENREKVNFDFKFI